MVDTKEYLWGKIVDFTCLDGLYPYPYLLSQRFMSHSG